MTADDRAALATQLQQEAGTLLGRTGLFAMLQRRYGTVLVTGSAGYDLMVERDIDLHLPVEADAWTEWAGLAGDIAGRLQAAGLALHRASFLNDYVEPHPLGAGLYWGIAFRDGAGHAWKCDIWGWDPFDFAVRQARDDSLRVDLARADRDLILRLKHEARACADGRVTSFDIYQFAIAGAGDTLAELEAWKARR